MAIFRSLIYRFSQSPSYPRNSCLRTFFSLSWTSPSPISPPFLLYTPVKNYHRHFLFRSRFLFPICGPLFLCNPPWKLPQSATPRLLQPDVASYFIKLRALNILQKPSFPHNLSFRSPCDTQKLLAEGVGKEFRNASAIDARGSHGVITDSYFNLPNFISFVRLLSGPLLGWMIANDMYSYAFIGLAVSGATDWLDGYMARKMGINYVVGSYLDPLADKVLIGCVALAMVDKDLIHRTALPYFYSTKLDWFHLLFCVILLLFVVLSTKELAVWIGRGTVGVTSSTSMGRMLKKLSLS